MNLTCAWCLIANATLLNIEWPDLNSQYYATIVNNTNLTIKGQFPNARYFSFELYSLDTWEPYWDVYDQNIDSDINPYNNQEIIYNKTLNYTINITPDLSNKETILIYRIYKGIDLQGGVDLPELSYIDYEIPQCSHDNRPTILIQDTNSSIPLYKPNQNNNFYPPQEDNNLFRNDDARYMVAYFNNTKQNFKSAVVEFKLPYFPKNINEIASKDYDVRYYSISIIDLSSPRQTTQTFSDEEIYLYSDENNKSTLFLHCIDLKNITLQLYPPTKSNCSSIVNYFGVLYRQLLPKFKNMIPVIKPLSNYSLKVLMGDYYPMIYWT